MFDNILNQSATTLLTDDILNNRLPNSVLFSGPESSGKLSCALETARILSCKEKGEWTCRCSSCLQHKAMVSQNLLIMGSSSRTLEIDAARTTLLQQSAQNSRHLEAAVYLYIRAIRKLTVRFSSILWEGDKDLSKFSALLETIDDGLELIQPGRVLPDDAELKKIVDEIGDACKKLESTYLYDSIPVSQIRKFSAWAHLASSSGKKVLIIEHADLMAESSRNALLKILEEPPEDVVFILTTARRGAILPTILSRVRTYNFFERSTEQQQNLITRIFHYNPGFSEENKFNTINEFLQSYLSVKPVVVHQYSSQFFKSIAEGHVPAISDITAGCANFTPRVLYKIFLQGIINEQKKLLSSNAGCESSKKVMEVLYKSFENVSVFYQNPQAALEELTRSLMQINYLNGGILKQ